MQGRLLAGLGVALLVLAGGAAAQDASVEASLSDPTGDVQQASAQYGNGTGGASTRGVAGHEDVDLTALSSHGDGTDVVLVLQVAGTIRSSTNVQMGQGGFSGGGYGYNVAIDDRNDSAADATINWGGGSATFRDAHSGNMTNVPSSAVNGTLTLRVPRGLLRPIEHWTIAAQATQTQTNATNGNVTSESFTDEIGPYSAMVSAAMQQGAGFPGGVPGYPGSPGGPNGSGNVNLTGLRTPGPGPALLGAGLAGAALLTRRARRP